MKQLLTFFYSIIILSLLAGCAAYQSSETQFVDGRDWQVYKTVKIDSLIWMLDNLNFNVQKSFCYDDKNNNCETYGKLYTWESAFEACPPGWRLPTEKEIRRLVEFFGNPSKAADILIKEPPEGFNIPYAGSRYFSGEYTGIGEYAVYWTSTEVGNEKAVCMSLEKNRDEKITFPEYLKTAAFSVRCVRKAK